MSLFDVQAAVQTLRNTPPRLRQALQAHRNELLSLNGNLRLDARLSDEGRQAALAAAGREVAARTTQLVDAIIADAQFAAETIDGAVEAAKPPKTVGLEGMHIRRAHWGRVKELLGSGLRLRTVIDEATDPEALHAIAEELPTWLRMQQNDPRHVREGMDVYEMRIDRRFAAIAPASLGAAASAALEAWPDVVALPPLIADARRAAASTDPASPWDMRAAIASRLDRADATRQALYETQPPRRRLM